MLQYLFNATAIWLLSLALFDLFLRKESYHNYNRFYLLFTFFLGASLPLFNWQHENTPITLQPLLQKPVQQIIAEKQTIITTASFPASRSFDWAQLLMIIYIAGVAIAFCLLLMDIIKLSRFYNSGTRSKQGNWTIIETGKQHAPFSFLNTLFIHSTAQYDKTEWDMIFTHEKRHYTLFHFADLMLMQVARITCWFHPLVYVYNKRLLLVHEYQADKTPSQPEAYSKFLIEQAILNTAPTLSHSFNRSPIKNRIVMLTRRSPEIAKSKLLLFVPLVVVCILCFSQNSFSNKPKKEGNVCIYRGNKIEFLAAKKPDSYLYTDEQTGEKSRRPISWPMPPIKLNGEKIYNLDVDKNVEKPMYKSANKNLVSYIIQNAKKEMETLDDGNYFILIEDVVIDSKGKIAYFDNQGLGQVGADIDKQAEKKQNIENKISDLMNNAPALKPAHVNSTPVPFFINSITCYSYGYNNGWDFTVKNHKITWDVTSGVKHP